MDKKNMGESDKRVLIEELVRGLELARQLQINLNLPSSSNETRDLLIQRIISTFQKALQFLNWNTTGTSLQQQQQQHVRMSDSPPLSGTSPQSEDSDRDFNDPNHIASKKRNAVARWSKQIRVTPGMGMEGPLDDGFSWRKYGQKDILGATYPRGYYRCTHRNVQGCLATKQVQRSDEDPTIFEITYRGKHTCTLSSNIMVSPTSNINESHLTIPPQQQQQQQQQQQNNINVVQSLQVQKPNEILLNLRESLKVQTENLDSPNQSFSPFYNFPLTNSDTNHVFPETIENFNYPSYVSPATATSGILSNFSGHPTSVSQISDMIIPAATTSPATSSPTFGLEYPFDQFQFGGHNFTFDNTRFF